jgi:hypothetical protein
LVSNPDSDGDGTKDKEELDKGTDPNDKADFPIDPNNDEDDDGIIDTKEKECKLDPNVADANQDKDADGLSNKVECLTWKTNVNKVDTDDDGYSDAKEIEAETDPLDSESFPKSHVLNIIMFVLGSGAIVGGIMMFPKQKQKDPFGSPMPDFNASQKAAIARSKKDSPLFMADSQIVDFKETRGQIQQEIKSMPKIHQADSLDHELQRKREMLKMRKMSSIFDEFAHDDLSYDNQKIDKREEYYEQKKEERAKTFDRLDNISDNNAFEQLEVLGKKGGLSKYESDRLERLSRRGSRK